MDLTKTCPVCSTIQKYISKYNLEKAIKNNTKCKICCMPDRSGEKNSFYGRKHTEETLKKQSLTKKGKINNSSTKFKKGENCGTDNNMHNTSVYKLWIEKYGKEEADKKMTLLKTKHSKNNSGKGNPMYGKRVKKSGNGYSGWYKNWFFRSLRELSFIYNLELENSTWESAENLSFYIEYIDCKGSQRTYKPDFLIKKNILVEIKPLKLQKTKDVLLKKEAAELFCKENGYVYLITDCEIIDLQLLKSMYDNKIIKFTDKTEKKFIKYYNQYIKKAVRNLHP